MAGATESETPVQIGRPAQLGYGGTSLGAFFAFLISALAASIAVAALVYRSSLLPGLRSARLQAAEYIAMTFASIALIVLYAGFAKRLRLHRFFEFPGLIIPSAALLAAGVYKLAMHQFGGFDEGLAAHAATYYAQGFKPFVDFPCPMPPLFMAGIRCGVLLGLRWSSISLVSAVFAALTCLWIFALLQSAEMPRQWAFAVAICVEVATMLEAPFWWYNNSSAVSVVLLMLSAMACLVRQKSLLPWISLAFSLALVLSSKPNIAFISLVVLPLLATKDRSQWMKTLRSCAGALGLAAGVFYVAQMPPLAVLHSYMEIAKLRGSPLKFYPYRGMTWYEGIYQGVFTVLVVYCLTDLLFTNVRRKRVGKRLAVVFAVAAFTSVEMACTNAEYECLNLVPMLVAIAFLCVRPWEAAEPSSSRKIFLVGVLSVFVVMGGLIAATHLRIRGIGERMFYESLPTRTIQGGFFNGLEAGPRLQRVLGQTRRVLSAFPDSKVFFGPRMECMYAVFDKPLTPGMPLLWDGGNLYPKERVAYFLLKFQEEDPDVLIFLKDDFTRMDAAEQYIRHSGAYHVTEDFSDITVFIRRKEVPIDYVQLPEAATPPPR